MNRLSQRKTFIENEPYNLRPSPRKSERKSKHADCDICEAFKNANDSTDDNSAEEKQYKSQYVEEMEVKDT